MFASNGRASARLLALLLAAALTLGLPTAAFAKGKPIRPSTPTDLVIGTITGAGASAYNVPVTWKAGANNTSFQATVLAGTTVLARATLTTASWTPFVSARAGTVISVQVVGVYGKFKSAAAVASKALPDLTAPVGRYQASWTAPSSTGPMPVQFTELSLTDDVSSRAGIAVKVDFGDNTTPVTNPTFPLVHDYAVTVGEAKRYQPSITVTDAAGNAAAASVNAVVVFDSVKPTGTATVAPARGWARWTGVTLRTTATDNLSPAANIKRTIAWGDGTTSVTFGDRTLRHVYAVAGTFQPTVTLLDEAIPANDALVTGSSVVVSKDVYAPTVTLTLPRTRKTSIRSWKVLRGSSRDAQTAVRLVRVKAVEKRGTAYYAYVPAQNAWVKAGRKARAFAKAGYLQVATTGAWGVRVPKLTKGVLVYRVQATDVMGNVSAVVQHSQRLTKR